MKHLFKTTALIVALAMPAAAYASPESKLQGQISEHKSFAICKVLAGGVKGIEYMKADGFSRAEVLRFWFVSVDPDAINAESVRRVSSMIQYVYGGGTHKKFNKYCMGL